jgi:hypothetical protein
MEQDGVCVANITRRGRIRRAVTGVVALGAAAAAWFVLLHGATSAEALLLIPPVAFGWLCILQAAANT